MFQRAGGAQKGIHKEGNKYQGFLNCIIKSIYHTSDNIISVRKSQKKLFPLNEKGKIRNYKSLPKTEKKST